MACISVNNMNFGLDPSAEFWSIFWWQTEFLADIRISRIYASGIENSANLWLTFKIMAEIRLKCNNDQHTLIEKTVSGVQTYLEHKTETYE